MSAPSLRPARAPETVDLAIVGAGAAGLMAAIAAGRAAQAAGVPLAIAAFDGAAKLGTKILVAGGGRCNVTHDVLDPRFYAGSSQRAVAKVLRSFDVPHTIAFFHALGVPLKREETGKLFPVSDSARTVLDALLGAARAAGVSLVHPCRVTAIARDPGEAGHPFTLTTDGGPCRARAVILATGGRSLPKSGSDGGGYRLAAALGHTLTEHIFPALVPLITPAGHFTRALSGVAAEAALSAGEGKARITVRGAVLCTHFGLSGPAALDISRFLADARRIQPNAPLRVNWLPDHSAEQIDRMLQTLGRETVGRWLSRLLPERLARALLAEADLDPATTGDTLAREKRRVLAGVLGLCAVPIEGDRGFTYAEVTAGGVPLHEVQPETMASRITPGLFLCGELCDVDGRIGGYNFGWAWASGDVAGRAAVRALVGTLAQESSDS